MDHQPNYSSGDKFAMQLKDFNHIDSSNGDLYDASAELDNIEEAEQLSVRLQYGITPFTKRFKLLFERLSNRFA
ncbi:unnamed protein product [Cylicostephanus goldi]|uniref:Uncharacterized protein n=1 Tax=Cylicostephanus goldi TaxID=71465 RepID=A0A3P7Q6F5_CYLGO|nr:unnamed protein product [Cylicostephanus goldi]